MPRIFPSTTTGDIPANDIYDFLKVQLPIAGLPLVNEVFVTPVITGSTTFAVSSATDTSVTRSGGVNWASTGSLKGGWIKVVSGTGASVTPIRIVNNTLTSITVSNWPAGTPDTSSTIEILQGHSVYRSSGVLNKIGKDFYILVRTTLASIPSAQITISEHYNPISKMVNKYPPNSPSSETVSSDGSIDNPAAVSVPRFLDIQPSGQLRLDADENGFLLGGTLGIPVEAGIYDSLIPNDVMPIFATRYIHNTSSTSSYGVVTREYDVPPPAAYNFRIQAIGSNNASSRRYAFAPQYSSQDQLSSGSIPTGGGTIAARICFVTSRNIDTLSAFVRAVGRGMTSSSGGAVGDTLVLSKPDGTTETYVLCQVGTTTLIHTFIRIS